MKRPPPNANAYGVSIERRFARSARIDADLNGTPPLRGYVLQASIERALVSMAESQADMQQGAFTWTGPYGGGKSSAALLTGNLVGGAEEGRKLARSIAGRNLVKAFARAFPEQGAGWDVIPVTGSRTELRSAIADAAGAALSWRAEVVSKAKVSDEGLVRALLQASEKKRSGVLLILDELGKFFEYAVASGGDIHLLQDLAEASTRSKGRLVVVGILHQSFDQYADRAARTARTEWSKVQGRFQDISFVAGVDETVALLGRAIVAERPPEAAHRFAEKVADAVSKRRPTDVVALSKGLSAVWPLNPVTALLLGPVSRQRFAQNERSVFGFLTSAEPFGFQDFLQSAISGDLSKTYDPDRLWDYMSANFGMALASGPDSLRYSLAVEAIDRASAKGGLIHVALAKSAALIELFRNGSGVAVSKDFLIFSAPSYPRAAVERAVGDLLGWAVLIEQPRLGGYAIFAGSDFDLQRAIDRSRVSANRDDIRALPGTAGFEFAVAKHHYFRTGALRAFEVNLVLMEEGWRAQDIAAEVAHRNGARIGALVGVVPPRSLRLQDGQKLAALCAQELHKLGGFGAITVIPDPAPLLLGAEELTAINRVLANHPQLHGDRIAKREISARISKVSDDLCGVMSDLFDMARWWISSAEPKCIEGSLSVVATGMADEIFPFSPILKSELVQRDRLSSNAAAAVRELAYAMVSRPDQPLLGIQGYPAEMGLYLTVLKPFGLHGARSEGKIGFNAPDHSLAGRSLSNAWLAFKDAKDEQLSAVYEKWAKPPYGLKKGLMPILALASILSRREKLAIYVDGIFQTTLDTLFVDRLLQNPSLIRVRRADRSTRESAFLQDLGKQLNVDDKESSISVAKELFRRFYDLPQYVQRTESLPNKAKEIMREVLRANDPESLLFDRLPKILPMEDPAKEIIQALHFAENCFAELKLQVRHFVARSVGVDSETFGGLADRVKTILGLTNDLRFESFATRVASFDGGVPDMDGLASLLVHKPMAVWTDRDRDQAFLEVAQLGRRLRELEALVVVRDRKSKTEAMALVVGLDPKFPPILTSFELTSAERAIATRLAGQLGSILGKEGTSASVQLAALARAVALIAGEDGVTQKNGN